MGSSLSCNVALEGNLRYYTGKNINGLIYLRGSINHCFLVGKREEVEDRE